MVAAVAAVVRPVAVVAVVVTVVGLPAPPASHPIRSVSGASSPTLSPALRQTTGRSPGRWRILILCVRAPRAWSGRSTGI